MTLLARPAALIMPLALAGCMAIGGGGTTQVEVTDDLVAIAGPRGYCVDTSATRDTGETAFVLLGNCAAISGSRFGPQPSDPAVLTATISAPGEPDGIAASLSELPEFFASTDGRQALSRTGDAETVAVIQSFALGEAFFVNATDTSPGVVPGTQDAYWRAYFDVGPRIVTLSILTLEGATIDDAAQLETLEAFVASVQAANPPPGTGSAAAPAGGGGFLGGLFGGGG
ncbi:MAG: hypothetical protein AAF914_09445 [Pseudomonadota bacterium]